MSGRIGNPFKGEPSHVIIRDDGACPSLRKHTPAPSGYAEWHEWARKKVKTHDQFLCPDCGRFAIWKPKRNRAVSAEPRETTT